MELQKNKQLNTLKWAAILSATTLIAYLVRYYLNKESKEIPSILSYLNYLSAIVLVSPEYFSKKKWKSLIIIGFLAILYTYINELIYKRMNHTEEMFLVLNFLSLPFFFLLVRNILGGNQIKTLTLFFGAFLININSNSINRILYEASKLIDTSGKYQSIPIPIYIFFTPIVFWCMVFIFDWLSTSKTNKDFSNIEVGLEKTTYFSRIKLLNLVQIIFILVLFYLIHQLTTDIVFKNHYQYLSAIAASITILILVWQTYIQSIKRLIRTDKKETFLYLFSVPLINLIPAYYLYKAKDTSHYSKLTESNRVLTFCRNCLNKKDDFKKGLICSLTSEKATFSDTCKGFQAIEDPKPLPPTKSPSSVFKGVILFIFLMILMLTFRLILVILDTPSLESLLGLVVSAIIQIVLLYYLSKQKKWAVIGFMVVLLSNVLVTIYSQDSIRYFLPIYLPFLITSFLLVICVMPSWRYFTQKPKQYYDYIDTNK